MLRQVSRIARNWRLKLFVQKIIGFLPDKYAFTWNDRLISLASRNVSSRIDTIERANRCLANLRSFVDRTGRSLRGLSVLELGTGWHGIDLMMMHLAGCSKIVTIDHWEHLHFEAMHSQIAQLASRTSELRLDLLGIDSDFARMRLRELESIRDFKSLLSSLRIEYHIAKSCSPTALTILPKSIDFFYVFSVLQRIPNDDLKVILKHVGQTLLAEDAAFYICTDQKDINSQGHIDQSLWGLRFLRYSDWFFDLLSSSKLNSQNRLRESDFEKLLTENGMRPSHVISLCLPQDLEKCRTAKLDKRFAGYDLRDLATTQSTFIGWRKLGEALTTQRIDKSTSLIGDDA